VERNSQTEYLMCGGGARSSVSHLLRSILMNSVSPHPVSIHAVDPRAHRYIDESHDDYSSDAFCPTLSVSRTTSKRAQPARPTWSASVRETAS
jgi:hypothetical protein